MMVSRHTAILRTIPFLIVVCFVVFPADAKYSGGTGEPNDPYQIATAADLIALGSEPNDYDKHFILTADIDLDPNLPGRKVFDKAVVAPDTDRVKWDFQGTRFTGVFDGNGHTVSHLMIKGSSYLGFFGRLDGKSEVQNLGVVDVNITGSGYPVGGLVGENSYDAQVTQCYSTGAVSGTTGQYTTWVGGLVGANYGTVTECYSTGVVSGYSEVGGLVARNWGAVTSCYSTGAVTGNDCVGGLVGANSGAVIQCYSTGTLSSLGSVGGLVGYNWIGIVTASFWDIETSGQAASEGGTGLTTPEMQTAKTYRGWTGWGPVWTIDAGRDYPRLAWEDMPGEPIGGRTSVQGTGTPDDPYLIYTPEQLNAIGVSPSEWDKHFRAMADINLSDFDSKAGRPTFNIIAPGRGWEEHSFIGLPFTGVFDGNGHTISHLTLTGDGGLGLFGGLEYGGAIRNLGVVDVNVTGSYYVGGLVGHNRGSVTHCYSTGVVSGYNEVGGLVGFNGGTVTQCYSTGTVIGSGGGVGGLVGSNGADVTGCFWDTQTSGQATSAGGTGKTTAEMQTAKTFLDAGWDFLGETTNGTEDIWWILEGKDYPRLAWEFFAFTPDPQSGAKDVIQSPTLSWLAGRRTEAHDVYFGEDKAAVADATRESLGIYRGRYSRETRAYNPGALELGKTYYWRIDEVNEADPNSPWKGNVWSFTTGDFLLVLDDFESYTDDLDSCGVIFQTWLDGLGWLKPEPNYPGNGTGSTVGNENPPWAEQKIVHGGKQSMPMDYDNANWAWYSEAERTWGTPQNWTVDGADTLTLYFRGEPNNSPEPLYAGIEDSGGRMAVVVHPDAEAVLASEWQKWHIALGEVRAAGVDVAAVQKMVIGVGDRNNPKPGGTGRIYIDDIRLTKRMP